MSRRMEVTYLTNKEKVLSVDVSIVLFLFILEFSNVPFLIDLARRDDMESIGYIALYLLKGILPWQGLRVKSGKEKL